MEAERNWVGARQVRVCVKPAARRGGEKTGGSRLAGRWVPGAEFERPTTDAALRRGDVATVNLLHLGHLLNGMGRTGFCVKRMGKAGKVGIGELGRGNLDVVKVLY